MDRRGVTWRFTDDAFVSTSVNFMNMISERGEELKFGEVVLTFGLTDGNTGESYLRSTWNEEN